MYFRTEELSVGYKGKKVVSDISISLKKGEILSVIGPNGSGKSTFLRSISGLLEPLSGRVILDGREITAYREDELSKRIALLLTDRIKTEYMTGRELIECGRYPYTGRFGVLSDNDHKAVDDVISLTGTADIADRQFNSLSDGEKQMILVSRALCQEPELIIMDEPMSYLDIRYKLEMLEILKYLCREKGVTVIMSLHEVFLGGKVSDKLLAFKENGVFAYGSSSEVFNEGRIEDLFDIDDKGFSFIKSGYVLE